MNIVTFAEPVAGAFKKSAGGMQITFEANREYLLTNSQTERFMADANVRNRVYKLSRADMRIPNFRVGEKRGGKLLLFNGSGGYGDQILTWPLARILAQWYEVHIMTDPGNNVCWWQTPFVRSVNVIPIQWEMVKLFEHVVCFEYVSNMDEHADQEHPLDAMLRKIGIDPASIPASMKVVKPQFSPAEVTAARQWLLKSRRLGLYQLSSANAVRALPPEDSVFLLTKLVAAHPGIHWLALHDEFIPKEYVEQLQAQITARSLTNVEVACFSNLRELWALTEWASVVIAPDSMMVHIAGCFGTPCVGLWGPVPPGKRATYYANHHAIHHPEFCEHAPCHAYSANFPRYCPPKPNGRKVCELLAGIAPEEVIELVKKVAR